MNHERLEERRLEESDFIKNYVEKHKQELEELRAKAQALAFKGQYERLRRIKGQLDPDDLFFADQFSLKPL